MERNIYVDFDKNLITYNAPDLYSSVCANAAMLVKGDEGETYFLTDKGWYGTNETLSNFSYNAYTAMPILPFSSLHRIMRRLFISP